MSSSSTSIHSKSGFAQNTPSQKSLTPSTKADSKQLALTAGPVSAQFKPLSLPQHSKALRSQKLTPIDGIHQRLLPVITKGHQDSEIFTHAIQKSIEGDILSKETYHKIPDAMFQRFLQTKITLQAKTFRDAGGATGNYSATKTIKEIAQIFGARHMEVSGSTAKDIIAGKGIPHSGQDIDLILYVDTEGASEDPKERIEQIVKYYSKALGFDQFNLPAHRLISVQDKSFGSILKPWVALGSHQLDITLKSINSFPPNQSENTKDYSPRWDSIQSSLKMLTSDGETASVHNLLSLAALEHLHNRGLLIFNPRMNDIFIYVDGEKEEEKIALNRVRKAATKSHAPLLHSLQPGLIERFYKEAINIHQNQFTNRMKSNSIPILTFKELLDEHLIMLNAYKNNELNEYDLRCLDICFAQMANTYVQKDPIQKNQTQQNLKATEIETLEQKIYTAQCASSASQDDISQEMLLSILKKPVPAEKLHPVCRIWLDALIQNTNFTSPLAGKASKNWIRLYTDHGKNIKALSDNPDQALALIDHNWKANGKKQAARKSALIKEMAKQISDNKEAIQTYSKIFQRNPQDEKAFQDFCQKMIETQEALPSEFKQLLFQLHLDHFTSAKTNLALIELSLIDDRASSDSQWQDIQNEAFARLMQTDLNKNELQELNRILHQHTSIEHFMDSTLAKRMTNLQGFTQFVEKISSKASGIPLYAELHFLKGNKVMSSITAQTENAQAAYLKAFKAFEKAMLSKDLKWNAFNMALRTARIGRLPVQGLELVSSEYGNLNKADQKSPQLKNMIKMMLANCDGQSDMTPLQTPMSKTFLSFLIQLNHEEKLQTSVATGMMSFIAHQLNANSSIFRISIINNASELMMQLLDILPALPTSQLVEATDTLARAMGISYKRTAEAIETRIIENDESDTEDEMDSHMELKKALQNFDGIKNPTQLDLIHKAEIQFSLDKPVDAFNTFKDSFRLGTPNRTLAVSPKLGFSIVNQPTIQGYMGALNYLQMFIIAIAQIKKNIPFSLIVQFMQAAFANQPDESVQMPSIALKIAGLLSSLKDVEFIDNGYVHPKDPASAAMQQLQAIELYSLNRYLKHSLLNKHDLTSQAQAVVSMFQYANASLHIQKKLIEISQLPSLKETQFIYASLNIILNFVQHQNDFISRAQMQGVDLKLHSAKGSELIKQLESIEKTIGSIVTKFKIITPTQKQANQYRLSRLKFIKASAMLNHAQPQTLQAILKPAMDYIQSSRALFNQDPAIKSAKDVNLRLKEQYGEYAIDVSYQALEQAFILAYLTNADIPSSSVNYISNNFDHNQLKLQREFVLKELSKAPSDISQSLMKQIAQIKAQFKADYQLHPALKNDASANFNLMAKHLIEGMPIRVKSSSRKIPKKK